MLAVRDNSQHNNVTTVGGAAGDRGCGGGLFDDRNFWVRRILDVDVSGLSRLAGLRIKIANVVTQ